jgi:hypothetical protein
MASNYRPFRAPIACTDNSVKTIFYVESDGRHLSAIGFDGLVQWTRNPFVDAHLKAYRVENPRIVWMGAVEPSLLGSQPDPKRRFIAIEFDSTEFGVVDTSNGDFKSLGRD